MKYFKTFIFWMLLSIPLGLILSYSLFEDYKVLAFEISTGIGVIYASIAVIRSYLSSKKKHLISDEIMLSFNSYKETDTDGSIIISVRGRKVVVEHRVEFRGTTGYDYIKSLIPFSENEKPLLESCLNTIDFIEIDKQFYLNDKYYWDNDISAYRVYIEETVKKLEACLS